MNRIESLPELEWSETAKRQIEAFGASVVQMSEVAYRIGDVAVAGLIYSTYTSPPWFWFALAKGVTMRHLIDFRRLQDRIPRGSLTGVEENTIAMRFADFYGFRRTGEIREHEGTHYNIMRKI